MDNKSVNSASEKTLVTVNQKIKAEGNDSNKGKLFTKEIEEKIVISMDTYKKYLSLVKSIPLLILIICLYVLSEGLYTAFYYYFGSYSN